MPWEYLQTPELDKRFRAASRFVVGKPIVADLNAGSCRFSNFIEYEKYYANDVDPNYNPKTDIDFQVCDDTVMVDYLKDKKIDLLCLWGHGAGHILKSEFESPSLTTSFLEIAENNQPEMLIIEASDNYEQRFGVLREIVSLVVDYEVSDKFITLADGEYGNRVGFVLRRSYTLIDRG